MLPTLTVSEYLNLVNAGNVASASKLPHGVYRFAESYVSYRKNKQQAHLGLLRSKLEDALEDLDEPLPVLQEVDKNTAGIFKPQL